MKTSLLESILSVYYALAHSAGAVLNIPHGEIIAVSLPHMMKYCSEEEKTAKHYSEIAHAIGIKFVSEQEGAEKLIHKVEELIDEIDLKTNLRSFGITEKTLEENMQLLSDFALNDTGSIVNPREITGEALRSMFYDMLGELTGGYREIILRVNLTTKQVSQEPLDLEGAKMFIGGSGLGAHYYFKFLNTKNVDALSPENILIFMTGPLTGLPTSCAGRFSVCSRSPLTGFWGEANSGGNFGPELKFAGYDGIIVEGVSEKPVYLLIEDDKIEIRDASELWGMGTYAAHEKILNELGDKSFKIACIGQAGENLVKYASIMNDEGRAAGRTGLGAVMGSKKLKAIAVKGSNKEFLLPKEFKEKSKEAYEAIKEDFYVELIGEFGTAGYLDAAIDMYGDLPIRNWSESNFDEASNLSGVSIKETILVGRYACYRCPIGCGRIIEIPEGRYKLPRTKGPEYETLGAFGTNLKIGNLEAISFATYKANDYGMDTISAGTTIGVLLDLVSKNYIPSEALPEELDLSFGNADTLLTLLDMITKRKGIGNLLAEGSKVLAENFLYSALAPQVAGLEAPFHDPRAFSGWAIQYLTSPRGACHNNGDAYMVQQGLTFPELEIDDLPDSRFEDSGIAKQMVRLQSYRQLYNAMTICVFYNPPAPMVADLLGMATNRKYISRDLILLGDRIYALKRLVNLRLGWKPELQVLPSVMRQRLDGPTEGNTPDYKIQLKEWYEYRNYDIETGYPKRELLEQLEMSSFIRESESFDI